MIPAYLLNRIHEKCFWCGETVTPHNAPDPRPQVEGLLDIDHVMHAYDLLTPGGELVSVEAGIAHIRAPDEARAAWARSRLSRQIARLLGVGSVEFVIQEGEKA